MGFGRPEMGLCRMTFDTMVTFSRSLQENMIFIPFSWYPLAMKLRKSRAPFWQAFVNLFISSCLYLFISRG